MQNKIIKAGIIQQHNTADITDNRNRLSEKIKTLAQQGAELVVLQELHDSMYFCQTEDTGTFDLRRGHGLLLPDSGNMPHSARHIAL